VSLPLTPHPVSGADPIDTRPGFAALLNRIEGNGVRVVIIEDASRFARDLMTQELGILSLIKLGVRVITATGDDLTDTSDPMKKAMRQIGGAFAEACVEAQGSPGAQA
jgi:DNA invertase Pin-like site-specific DNA recombinase